MATKKKVVEIVEKVEEVKEVKEIKVEKQVEEKRDFSIIDRETKQLKVIRKSEYNSLLHIAL